MRRFAICKGCIKMFDKEIINLRNPRQFAEISSFLSTFDLTFDQDVEYTIALRSGEKLVGTGSFSGEILRNIAIDENIQGSGLTSIIVSELMQEQARQGRMHYFIFTKPEKAHLFGSLGFNEIARAEPYVALLETGLGSVHSFCSTIASAAARLPGNRAAVVVNCNPFTKGHRALIEKAAVENPVVLVFVVSEDKSLFPFTDRIKLVRDGVTDLKNVIVVPGGSYIISSATFPTYFTRDENKVVAQTRLDTTLFATQIAPQLQITTRYVGEEPYCPVTNAYNQAMHDILPKYGISIQMITRIAQDGEIVSASKVREAIRSDDWNSIRKFVPDCTYEYLRLSSTQSIINKIKQSHARH